MSASPEIRKCQMDGCGQDATFEIYDTNETRPDHGITDSCDKHVGELIGSVPPTKPVGPYHVYLIGGRVRPGLVEWYGVQEPEPHAGELKQCPFCGNSWGPPRIERQPNEGRYSVYCMNSHCGASSGFANTLDAAVALWNQRVLHYEHNTDDFLSGETIDAWEKRVGRSGTYWSEALHQLYAQVMRMLEPR